MIKTNDSINQKINFKALSIEVCKNYNLGLYRSYSIINGQSNDINYLLRNNTGHKYLVKIFDASKDLKSIKEYLDTYRNICDSKISTYYFYKNNDQDYLMQTTINDQNIRLCVMEFGLGLDLMKSDKLITTTDVQQLAYEIAAIHNIKSNKPVKYIDNSFIYFKINYELKKKYLSILEQVIIGKLYKKYQTLKFDKLPKCFIHGDLIKDNIMVENENIKIIDFNGSGYGIRLFDIVKVLTTVIYDYSNVDYSKSMQDLFLKEYQKYNKLTKQELEMLNVCKCLDYATGIIECRYQLKENPNITNNYLFWLYNNKSGFRKN